ncbi:unnamed protein product [Urochloa decumbens]|uniref:Ankyrin repeat protein n=1 Tax=Urochloa decumbens TaxID=240449 RepID=A0ABC8VWV4_9POAL
MVKLLLAHGANLNRLSHDRRTPLVASIFGCSLECLRTFIEEGADITGSPVTPLSVAARKGLPDCIECLLNYNADPNEPNEVRFVEEYLAIGDGDSAFWEKEYTHALGCYNLAFKLGHEDPSLYAKRSLCHLGNREPLRYLDDALSYMNAKDPYPVLPYSEEDAKQSVMDYFRGWKARYLADEGRSRGCCHPNTTSLNANDSQGSKKYDRCSFNGEKEILLQKLRQGLQILSDAWLSSE